MQFFHSSIPITLDLQYGFVPIFWLLSCILSRCDILSLIQKFQSYSIFQHLLLSVTQLSALRINWHTIMWMLFLVVFSDWCKSWFGIRWRKHALLRQLMQKRKVEVLHKCASVYFGRNMFCDSYIGIPEFPLGSEQCVFLVQTWPPGHTIRILKTLHIVLRPLPHTSPVSATMRRSSLHSLMWLFGLSCHSGPQPEVGQSGNCLPPSKFSQTYVLVWCINKLHHFAPRKYQLLAALVSPVVIRSD